MRKRLGDIDITGAKSAIDGLFVGQQNDLAGFGILTEQYRLGLLRVLDEISSISSWQEHIKQKIGHTLLYGDIVRAVEIGAILPSAKTPTFRDHILAQVDQSGAHGLLIERMIAAGIQQRISYLTAQKTPHYIDAGGKDGPGLDIYIHDDRSNTLWASAITIKKGRDSLSHVRRLHREAREGKKSEIWYENGAPRYPFELMPKKFFSLHLGGMDFVSEHFYPAFHAWKDSQFTGEFHRFLAHPARERFQYFLENFESIWKAIDSTDFACRRDEMFEPSKTYPLSDGDIVRTISPLSHCQFDVRMHDATGFPTIATLQLPLHIHADRLARSGGDDFYESLEWDMAKIGWK